MHVGVTTLGDPFVPRNRVPMPPFHRCAGRAGPSGVQATGLMNPTTAPAQRSHRCGFVCEARGVCRTAWATQIGLIDNRAWEGSGGVGWWG
eukprot:3097202-Prymnesium_polylepis.1